MSDFEKFKEKFPSKAKFYGSLIGRKTTDKEYKHALNVWKRFEMKTMKDHNDMMMNCFCGMVNRRKVFSLTCNRDHWQRSSPL